MAEIKLKRVYKVLIERLWPRGIGKADLSDDLWEKEIAPSAELREWLPSSPDRYWNIFKKKYLNQPEHSPYTPDFVKKIKAPHTTTLII